MRHRARRASQRRGLYENDLAKLGDCHGAALRACGGCKPGGHLHMLYGYGLFTGRVRVNIWGLITSRLSTVADSRAGMTPRAGCAL